MKFSWELQRELEEHNMWLDVVSEKIVNLWILSDGAEYICMQFVIRDGGWCMSTMRYPLIFKLDVVACLLTVMGELTKHSVENGILDVPNFLI